MLGKNMKRRVKVAGKSHSRARQMHASKKPKHAARASAAIKKRMHAKIRSMPKAAIKSRPTSEERKEARERQIIKNKKETQDIYRVEVKKVIEDIVQNDTVMDYLRKNVSRRAEDVLKALTSAKTDEQIAAELGIKINMVRRVLNILQGYGVTNYMTLKSSKGWLSFLWTINLKKVDEFYNYVNSSSEGNVSLITNESDDYFVCDKCYVENKLIFDFDSAFEANFKCMGCGSSMRRISREDAKKLEQEKDLEKVKRLV